MSLDSRDQKIRESPCCFLGQLQADSVPNRRVDTGSVVRVVGSLANKTKNSFDCSSSSLARLQEAVR